jgi:hypothetical protein
VYFNLILLTCFYCDNIRTVTTFNLQKNENAARGTFTRILAAGNERVITGETTSEKSIKMAKNVKSTKKKKRQWRLT